MKGNIASLYMTISIKAWEILTHIQTIISVNIHQDVFFLSIRLWTSINNTFFQYRSSQVIMVMFPYI